MTDTRAFPLIDDEVVKIYTPDVDIAAFWHTRPDGFKYLVIDIDSESEDDTEATPIIVYRNDAPVHREGGA